MSELVNQAISALLQIIVFTAIPFLFFIFNKDKTVSFSRYIGFYKPTGRSIAYVLLIAVIFLAAGVGLALFDPGIREMLFSPNSVTGKLRQMGPGTNTILILLIIALFKTSLSEEILFRGFIARRLIVRLGFPVGNILQSVIFGLVHLILFRAMTSATVIPLVIIFSFSTLAGWCIGLVKEKYANGSIIPGWIAHGLGNTISYYIIAFII
jgi:uncharacterized protein